MLETMPEEEDDGIEVRRFSDPIAAAMIRDFLEDHEVRVAIRGNPQATRMTWSQTSDVLRIVVAGADRERAEEALLAMTSCDQHPFRGPAPPPEDEADAGPLERRGMPRGLGAVPLAIALAFLGAWLTAR